MAVRYQIRPFHDDDFDALEEGLRAEDRREITALSGFEPGEGLLHSILSSRECFVATADGVPFAIWGGIPDPDEDGEGLCWLLATDDIARHWVWFGRSTGEIVATVLREYRRIWNLADARNTLHQRWLKWAGFEVMAPFTLAGAKDPTVPWTPIEMENPDYV